MSSPGAQALLALQTRLQKLTFANGYAVDVQSVNLSTTAPRMNTAEQDLPLIDIVNDTGDFQHDGASSGLWTVQTVYLSLVAPKDWTDLQMEDFMEEIRKCLYGDSPTATGNTGMTLGGVISSIFLLDSTTDLNMIDANRMYIFRMQMRRHGRTYSS